MPKVSVIIAAYNAMAYLPTTVNNLFEQTHEDFEVIIVNDGSQDNLVSWVSQLSDPRVKLISQENSGLATARNTGISNAEGEYVAFLDADDLWHPSKLEKQVAILDTDPSVALTYSWVNIIDEQGNFQGKTLKNSYDGNVWSKLVENDILECGSNAMLRRACFQEIGVFDTSIVHSSDWEFWLRLAARYSFKAIRESLVYYRIHPNNLSKKWEGMEVDFYEVLDKVFLTAPQEFQSLKPKSYGLAHLRIAWKALQNSQGASADSYLKKALFYRRKALQECPELRFCDENLRLSLAIVLVRLFGLNGYDKFRNFTYSLKRAALSEGR